MQKPIEGLSPLPVSSSKKSGGGEPQKRIFSCLRYILKLQLKLPLYPGEANLSTKWRRSKQYLNWLDLKDSENTRARGRSKFPCVENMRTVRGMYPQKYRFSQSHEQRKWKEPKPLIDIFQEKNWITIIAEIAGFNKETLKIDVKDQKLTLSAKAKDRRYYKSLNLPKVVIPNIMHTTYKNGVLEIKLKKAEKEETINKQAE
jgi:HSP20 family molecular chaperone IbpA